MRVLGPPACTRPLSFAFAHSDRHTATVDWRHELLIVLGGQLAALNAKLAQSSDTIATLDRSRRADSAQLVSAALEREKLSVSVSCRAACGAECWIVCAGKWYQKRGEGAAKRPRDITLKWIFFCFSCLVDAIRANTGRSSTTRKV